MNDSQKTEIRVETSPPEAVAALSLWRVRSYHNRGSAVRWVVERGQARRVENAAGRAVRFKSEAAALEVANKLNGPPTHWMDERGQSVTDAFLQSKGELSDWRDAYTAPCVMLNRKLVASSSGISAWCKDNDYSIEQDAHGVFKE